MFTLTFPNYANSEWFSIVPTHNAAPMLILSIISIVFNLGVLVYEIKTVIKTKRNPLKEELYVDTKPYQDIMEANNL